MSSPATAAVVVVLWMCMTQAGAENMRTALVEQDSAKVNYLFDAKGTGCFDTRRFPPPYNRPKIAVKRTESKITPAYVWSGKRWYKITFYDVKFMGQKTAVTWETTILPREV